jgi:nucleoside 2-deoxyribosyltransferase
MSESKENKTANGLCFVLMPFDRFHNRIYADVIKPVVINECGYACSRGDEFLSNRIIMQEVWDMILAADVIIAELTDRNPNVFYELGLAHSMNKHVVLLTRSSNRIPFDVTQWRCVVYDKGSHGEEKLRKHLKETLMNVRASVEESSAPFWKREDDPVTLMAQMGVKRLYRDRSKFDKTRMDLLESAHQVSWLAIVPDLPAQFNMVEIVSKHVKRGCNFRILGWNPDSPYRALLEKFPELFPGMIAPFSSSLTTNAVERLKTLVRGWQGPGSLDVRLYDSPPTWYIQVIDTTMFVEPYLYRQQGIHSFMLQLDDTGDHRNPFRYFHLHFDTLFETAKRLIE